MFGVGRDRNIIYFQPGRSSRKIYPNIYMCSLLLSGLFSPGMTEEISAHDAQSIFSFFLLEVWIWRGLRPPVHFPGAHEHLPAGVGFHPQVQAKSCNIQHRASCIPSFQYWECSLPALKSQEIHNHRKNCAPILHKLWAGRCYEEEGWERSRWSRNRTEFIVFLVGNLN